MSNLWILLGLLCTSLPTSAQRCELWQGLFIGAGSISNIVAGDPPACNATLNNRAIYLQENTSQAAVANSIRPVVSRFASIPYARCTAPAVTLLCGTAFPECLSFNDSSNQEGSFLATGPFLWVVRSTTVETTVLLLMCQYESRMWSDLPDERTTAN